MSKIAGLYIEILLSLDLATHWDVTEDRRSNRQLGPTKDKKKNNKYRGDICDNKYLVIDED